MFLVFLTLPVTVRSAERQFSKLQVIETYLRNGMSQHRLSTLVLVNIQDRTIHKLDV